MSSYADRLAALREQLKSDRLDGFVVPLTDYHPSVYVGGYASGSWLTEFEGSAGSAVVLADRAAIFTDGRYTLQARAQVHGNLFSDQAVPETCPAEWLKVHAPQGGRIGHDPWLHGRVGVAGEQGAGGGEVVEACGRQLFGAGHHELVDRLMVPTTRTHVESSCEANPGFVEPQQPRNAQPRSGEAG